MSGREAGDFLLGHAHGRGGDGANSAVVASDILSGGPLKSPQNAALQGAHGAHAQQRMAAEQGILNLNSAVSARLGVPSAAGSVEQAAASRSAPSTMAASNGDVNGNGNGIHGVTSGFIANGSSLNGASIGSTHDAGGATTSETSPAFSQLAATPLSDKAKGKARAIEKEQVPLELLEAELIPEEGGTVELKTIVQRVANYGFEMLQTMGETLPSLSSEERRAKIFSEALKIRKEFIKLLVIAQWAKIAPEMQRTRDLVTLISDQFRQPIDATDAITQIRRDLPAGRMRNYDIETAIDVLSSGTYTRVPTIIKDSVIPPDKFSDSEALAIVQELEDAIRRRLACDEVLPVQMASYRVSDGRAHFKVPGYFEAAVTLGGASTEDRWYLLTVKWDIAITGQGAEVFPQVLRKAQRAVLVALADQQLEPQSLAVEREDVLQALDQVSRDNGGGTRKDAPLMRMFGFLQDRALQYQLDVLRYQVSQLSRSTWGDNLRWHMESNPPCLVVQYWASAERRNSAARSGHSTVAKNPFTPGSIRIYVETCEQEVGTTSRVADLLSGGELSLAELHRQQVKRKRLQVQWLVDSTLRKELGFVQPEAIDPYRLDFKALLLSYVPRHSSATLRFFQAHIFRSPLGSTLRPEDCVVRTISDRGRQVTLLLVQLHVSLRVVIGISDISGRVFIQEVPLDVSDDRLVASASLLQTADLSDTVEARLAVIAQAANEDPRLLIEGLQTLRLQVTIEQIEQKAAYLEMSCSGSLPLSEVERSKFGQPPGALLWIPLASAPSYYLVPQVLPQSLRVALVLVGTILDGNNQPTTAVQILGWLNRARVAEAGKTNESKKRKQRRETPSASAWNVGGGSGLPHDAYETRHDMSIEELARLHSYGRALVSYFKVEQQLRMRDIPFVHVDDPEYVQPSAQDAKEERKATSQSPTQAVAPIVPILCVRAASLLEGTAAYVNRNVCVRLREWWRSERCRVEIAMEMKMRSGIPAQRTQLDGTAERGSSIEFNVATSVLTFSTHDVDNAVGRFLMHWKCVSRMATLAREVVRARRLEKGAAQAQSGNDDSGRPPITFQLRRFDLKRLEFSYAPGLTLLVCRADANDLTGNGRYELTFGTNAGPDGAQKSNSIKANPHQLTAVAMEKLLNAQDDADPLLWRNFLQLLKDTLPVLRVLATYQAQCLEDADCPEVEILSATWYRLHFLDTHALDISVLEQSRVLLTDASQPRFGALQDSQAVNDTAGAPSGFGSNATARIPSFDDITARVLKTWKGTTHAAGAPAPAFAELQVLDLRRAMLCINTEEVVPPLLERLVAEIKENVSL